MYVSVCMRLSVCPFTRVYVCLYPPWLSHHQCHCWNLLKNRYESYLVHSVAGHLKVRFTFELILGLIIFHISQKLDPSCVRNPWSAPPPLSLSSTPHARQSLVVANKGVFLYTHYIQGTIYSATHYAQIFLHPHIPAKKHYHFTNSLYLIPRTGVLVSRFTLKSAWACPLV